MLSERSQFYLKDWCVQPEQLRIVSPDGILHSVEPKIMDVLLCLTDQAHQVVLRETLMEKVWADCVVVDDTLTRCISQLRKILNEHPDAPVYIETIRSKGYRLLVAPSISPSSAQVNNSRSTYYPITQVLAIACVIILVFGIGWRYGSNANKSGVTAFSFDELPPAILESDSTLHMLSLSGTENTFFFLEGDSSRKWIHEEPDSLFSKSKE